MDSAFFILSKIAWGLLSPTSLIIWIMVLATGLLMLGKVQLAKWLLVPTSLISAAILSYPLGDMLIFPLETRFSKPIQMPQQIDGIIILGGGEELKPSISWHSAELGQGGDRYVAASQLAKRYPDVPIIFAGGSGLLTFQNSAREADIASQLLLAMGIDQQRLIIESHSRNTYENFLLMKPKLPKIEGHYLLVTSAFHMARAVGVARKQNINVIAYPVDYRSNVASLRQWDFNMYDHLEVLEPAWREWIGLTVYYMTGKTSTWFSN